MFGWLRRQQHASTRALWLARDTACAEHWKAVVAAHGTGPVHWHERPLNAPDCQPSHRRWSVGPLRWTLWFVPDAKVRQIALRAWLDAGARPDTDQDPYSEAPCRGWPHPHVQGPAPLAHATPTPLWTYFDNEEDEALIVEYAGGTWGHSSLALPSCSASSALGVARSIPWIDRLVTPMGIQHALSTRLWHPDAARDLLPGTEYLLRTRKACIDAASWYTWACRWSPLQPHAHGPSPSLAILVSSSSLPAPVFAPMNVPRPQRRPTDDELMVLGVVMRQYDPYAADNLQDAFADLFLHSRNLDEALQAPEVLGHRMRDLVGLPTSWATALSFLYRHPNTLSLRFWLAWGLPPNATHEGYDLAHRWVMPHDGGMEGFQVLLDAGATGAPDATGLSLAQWCQAVWAMSPTGHRHRALEQAWMPRLRALEEGCGLDALLPQATAPSRRTRL